MNKIIFFSLFFLAGCFKQSADVSFKVVVKTNQNETVSGATVFLDNQEIGRANENGVFTAKFPLEHSSTHSIKVTKDNDLYYFSPFTDTFKVEATGQQEIIFQATLFVVPKPASNTAENSTAPAQAPIVKEAEPIANASAISVVEKPAEEVVEEKLQENKQERKQDVVAEVPKQEAIVVHSFLVMANKLPISKVKIGVTNETKSLIGVGCTSLDSGRCVIKIPESENKNLIITAQKAGFLFYSKTAEALTAKSSTIIPLEKGNTLEIQSFVKRFDRLLPLSGAEVYVRTSHAGTTAEDGTLLYGFKGKLGELVPVKIVTKQYLPTDLETDFVVSNKDLALTNLFAPSEAPKFRIGIQKLQSDDKITPKFSDMLENHLLDQFRVISVLSVVPRKKFEDDLTANKRTISQLVKKGWTSSDMHKVIDGVIAIKVTHEKETSDMEISLVGSAGRVIAAAREKLAYPSDTIAADRLIQAFAKKLSEHFPYEGAVIERTDESLKINLGTTAVPGLKVGDSFEVFGLQSDLKGKTKTAEVIGTAEITDVGIRSSTLKIKTQKPRSVIGVGSIVAKQKIQHIVATSAATGSSSSSVQAIGVWSDGKTHSLPNVNLYFNKEWIGSTNQGGGFNIPSQLFGKTGELVAAASGFETAKSTVTLTGNKVVQVKLNAELSRLMIDSVPSGAVVMINGAEVGKTPLSNPVPVKAGFVRIEIQGSQEFKKYSSVMELEEGLLDLTKNQSIRLEKDYLTYASDLMEKKKTEEAIKVLSEVPSNHTDFLTSRHKLGEIYLSVLHQPGKAAKFFSQVTTDQKVAQFIDKRFIGSHINEGVALVQAGDDLLKTDQGLAITHFKRAAEILARVEPYIRFVPPKQFEHASISASYHRALALQKIGSVEKNVEVLEASSRQWQKLLEANPIAGVEKAEERKYVTNAQEYLKQTNALMQSNPEQTAE